MTAILKASTDCSSMTQFGSLSLHVLLTFFLANQYIPVHELTTAWLAQKRKVKRLTFSGSLLIRLLDPLKYSGKEKFPMKYWDCGQMLLKKKIVKDQTNVLEISSSIT